MPLEHVFPVPLFPVHFWAKGLYSINGFACKGGQSDKGTFKDERNRLAKSVLTRSAHCFPALPSRRYRGRPIPLPNRGEHTNALKRTIIYQLCVCCGARLNFFALWFLAEIRHICVLSCFFFRCAWWVGECFCAPVRWRTGVKSIPNAKARRLLQSLKFYAE